MNAPMDPAGEKAQHLKQVLTAVLGAKDLLEGEIDCDHGMATLRVAPSNLVEVLTFLRDNPECLFVNFTDMCGVDYPERSKRFDVVYHLLSPYRNCRIRIIVSTDESTPLPSVQDVYPAAGWCEREAYDLYGILFSDHPDLRRILTDYGFEGHPLRKDFPLTGFVEVRYDPSLRRVVNEPVFLQQEFRTFDFLSPWEGQELPASGSES